MVKDCYRNGSIQMHYWWHFKCKTIIDLVSAPNFYCAGACLLMNHKFNETLFRPAKISFACRPFHWSTLKSVAVLLPHIYRCLNIQTSIQSPIIRRRHERFFWKPSAKFSFISSQSISAYELRNIWDISLQCLNMF